MNISKILTAICSLMFLMIGTDKFLNYLEPPCSMMEHISPMVWKLLGVLQLASGVLIWLPKFKKYVVGFFAIFMYVFVIIHLTQGTRDINGALIMGILLSILAWNPPFIRGKNN